MKNTLKSKADFKAARRGKYINTDQFTVVLSKIPAGADRKIATVTGAKVGNAVERNRMRRVARVVLKDTQVGKNVMVIFKAKAAEHYRTVEGADLATDLRAAMK